MLRNVIIVLLIFAGIYPVKAQLESSISERNTQFAIRFYQQQVLQNPKKNICFSPYSISQSMAMVYAGAKNKTKEEMAQVLGFSVDQQQTNSQFECLNKTLNTNTDSVSFALANTLWAQKNYTFLPEYFTLLEEYYNAPLASADFKKNKGRKQATKAINNWVYDKTEKHITKLIEPETFDQNTRLVLVNAIYFYGAWQKAFDPKLSHNAPFYGSSETSVRYMFREQNLSYYTDDLIQAIAIPYKGEKQNLIILLPIEQAGLEKLEKTLDSFYLSNILNDSQNAKVTLTLPVFEAESKQDLSKIFIQMGMPDAFNNNADFSGITGKTELRIDKIIHAAKLSLNEEGTQAAAATAVVMARKSAFVPSLEFKANHPFIYVLIDNETQSILFMGRFVGA
jgi:serpin B